MRGPRGALVGIVLLLAGSVAAGLVVLTPAVPVAVGASAGLALVGVGLALVVRSVRDRLSGLRLSVQADPELAELVASRFGADRVRAWDLLAVAASAPGARVGALRDAAREAHDVDDLAARLDGTT